MDNNNIYLPKLNFPDYDFSLSSGENGLFIFDPVRRKNVKLTPEEWVRQHIIKFLILDKNTPPSLVGVEKSLKIGRLHKRFDLVVFTKEVKPLLLVECKAPDIVLNENVLNQVARYNSILKAKYFMISNGVRTILFCYNYSDSKFVFIEELPEYRDMLAPPGTI